MWLSKKSIISTFKAYLISLLLINCVLPGLYSVNPATWQLNIALFAFCKQTSLSLYNGLG